MEEKEITYKYEIKISLTEDIKNIGMEKKIVFMISHLFEWKV